MNKGRYRLVYSDEHGSYVPVPEETSARSKGQGARALRRLVAAMAAALPGLAIANPTGHQVMQGQVGIQQQGSTLNITASDKAIIHWKQFSIQPGETTRFIQPSSTATVLNRVVGQDPSQILGNLIANGRVFLINPNGVLFGAGAKVDTAGLVASTLNIKNEDFNAGRLKFEAEGAAGRIRNEGSLKTTGGPLLLIATDVENTGLITAENGDIVLAAGKSVEIADPHQPALRVRIEAGGEAINLGQLIAKGGNAGMFGAALTQAGKISATGAQRTADGRIVLRGTKSVTLTAQSETSAQTADGNGGAIEISAPEVKIEAKAVVDASGLQGGRIDVNAGQHATVEGTLRATGRLAAPTPAAPAPAPADLELPVTASGPAPAPVAPAVTDPGKGGHIQVTADTVAIAGSATLDASGDTGGGSVLVGGDWQGANPLVHNAQVSWVGSGAHLLADALLDGDGGKVVVWADQASAFHGNIWARGGRDGGNGGQVEVSGKVALLYRGRTDTSAARGRNGSLLLDPLSIVIQGGSGDGANDGSLSYNGGTAGTITAESLGPTVVYESELEEQSKTTDIILRAQRSVTVGNAQFNYTASGNASGETAGQLTLAAGSSLLIETRNLGAGEGGVSAGIDLVTGGWHGAGLRIVTQGSGSITLQTGYNNGVQVGDQRADIVLPVLQTASGGILARAGSSSLIDLRGTYRSDGAISMQAGTVSGAAAFNAAGGTQITGDYLLGSGTVSFDGGNASISGLFTLNGNLGGASALSVGGLLWQGGQMLTGGQVTLNGAGQVDGSNAYRYLGRRLDVAGQLDLSNSNGYELIVLNGGELHLNAGGALSSTTADGIIRLTAGSGGSALLSGDAGSRIEVAAGRSLYLRTDGAAGSAIAGQFDTAGDGALSVDGGRLSTAADTAFTGTGTLRLFSGGTLSGSHRLTLGNRFEWKGGALDGSGIAVLSGTGVVDNSASYHYLARTLQVDGTLTLGNSSGYLLYINDGGRLHLGATGTLSTDGSTAYIYMNAGANGVARLSGDTGARVVIGDGAQLYLRTDNTGSNRLSGTLNIGGAGMLTLDSGSVSVTDTALLTGSGTVRLSNGGDIGGAGTLTIASNLDWRGGSMSNAAGTTVLAGVTTIDNTSGYKYLGRQVVLTGSMTLGNSSGYYLQIHNGGRLHLAGGSRLATSTDSGMIYLAGGTSGAALSADAGSAITAAAGTVLTLQSDGNPLNTLAGRFTFDGAGEVRMPSGLFTTAAATTFTGSGLLRLNGATLDLRHATEFASPLVFDSGVITGSGNVLLSGNSRWNSGSLAGTGTATVSGRLQVENSNGYKFLSRRLVVDGALDFGSSTGYYLQLNNGGVLHLGATGVLRTTSSSSVIYLASGNGGVATVSADDGARVIAASGADLFLRSDSTGGNRIAGSFELTGSGDLVLDSGTLQTGAVSVIDGTGRLRLSGSATLNAEHALTLGSAFRFDGGVLGGSAATTISGAFTWAGGTMAGTGSTTIAGSGTVDNTAAYKFLNRSLTVSGSLMFGNSSGYYLQLNNGSRLRIAAGATLGTSTADGVIYMASGTGGSALITADSGSNIQLAAGTALRLRSDNAGSNGIAGSFNLAGEGALHLDSGTVSADAATAFTGDGRLLLSSGGALTGSALVTIASAFDWTGGSMAGTGTTRLLRDVSLSGSGARHLNRTLEIAAGRTLSLGDNVTLQRSTSNGGTGGIVAQGTLLKSAGTGTAYVTYLDLSGNIASSSGVLSIYGNAVGTSLNGVNASTSGSGALRLDSGLFTLTNGQTFTVSGGRAELSGATLSTSGSTSITGGGVFALTAGTLNGTGTLTVTSGFDWTGGTMSGTGTTRLDTSVTLTGSGTRTLDRTLEIAAGRTLDIDDNVLIQRSTSSGGTGGIVALGAVRKAGGTGTAYLRYLDLSGNISAHRGILSIYGNSAGSRIAGAVLSSNGGTLRADTGTLLLNVGESAQIAGGTFELSGATLTATGNSSLDGAGTFSFTSGTINGPGTLTVNTATDWSGGNMAGSGITRLAGAARILSGSTRGLGRTLEIAGSTVASNLSGAVQIQDSARISVLSGGTLELNNSAVFSHLGSGRIDNAGLLLKTGSDSASLAMPVGNTGTLRVAEGSLSANGFTTNAGTLDLRAGSTLTTGSLQNTGVIQGSGALNLGSGTLTNAGIVRPGDGSSTGTLTVTGQFVQTAGGRIEADVLGTTAAQQDHLNISGSAQIDGALVLAPASGLTFGASDRYTVLSCGADACLSGAFASVNTGGLAVTPTTFSNAISFATGTIASTWISQTSGFWDVAANWAGGLIPTASTDVVIDQAGDLTVTIRNTSPASNFTVNSLRSNENITITGSTLTLRGDSVINGRLSMTAGTLTIGSQLEVGSMTLSGGTVSGGRLIASGTGNLLNGGTLSALQLMLGSRLTTSGTSTLSNVTLSRLGSGSDAGRIVVANGGDLRVVGTLTLDNGSVTLASDGSSTFLRSTSGAWSIAGNGAILFGGSHNAVRANNYLGYGSGTYSLSIGSGVTVAGSNGGYIYFGNNGTNAGTIEAATAGREIVVNAWNTTDTWTNAGTLRANGGILSLSDAWSSAGTNARIQLDSGTLFLGGSFNTASFNTLVRPADADRGALNLVGTLNNANATLNLNGATGTLNSGGTVAGGTLAIDNASGGAFNTGYAGISGSSFGGTNVATLDNVRLTGSTTIANGGDLRVVGALTLDNGSVTLASDGNSTFLRGTSGAWSIAGNGAILFGGSHNAVRASNYLGYGSGTYSLSIGSGVTVSGSNGGYIYFGNNGANAGTIEAATAGREIVVNAWNNTDTWNNTGTLRANGGILSLNDAWSSAGSSARIQLDSGTLFLGGSFNTASFNTLVRPADADRGALNLVGTLNNANATLNLNGATGTLNSGGTVAGGTLAIDNASGGAFNTGYAGISGSSFGGTNVATLDNVRLSGSATVANGGDLRVVGALTLDNGSVTLASDGSSTFLRSTSGAWSIAGNGAVLFGGSHNAVRASNYLGYGSGTYSLSIGSGVTVSGANGGYIYFGDNGTNAGLIEAVNAGKEISLNAWSSNSSWTQSGTLHLANGGQFHIGDNVINSGVLRGAGSINASGRTITSTGLVHAEGGVLSVTGNLTQAAGSTLRFDIGGTERGTGHSALDVNGTFTFGGTLQVVHTNGFTPAENEAFPLIRYTTRAGSTQFATLDVPAGSGYGSYYGVGTYLLARGTALNGQINEWISNSSGDWSTGTNWSLGVAPNSATMSVLMDRVGFTPTVTISSGSWTVGELISQEHLTMTGGSLTVVGETAIAGQLTLNNAAQLLTQGHLDLGAVTLNGSSQFTAQQAGHIASFVQNGGTSTFNGAGLAFDAIDIRGGTVNYNAMLALPSQVLRIANHTANLNADQGQTLIQLQSGTLNLNLGTLASDVDMSGGTLNVAGNTVANGRLDWTGGNINGSGTLTQNGVMTVGGNGSFGLGGGITLVHANSSGNSRMAKTGSYFYLNGSGTTLRNAAGAVLTLDSTDNTFGTYYSGGTGGLLQNQGTLIKTGSGVFRINSPTRIEQAGLLDIRAGSIDLSYSTGNVFSGNTVIAADSALTLTGSQSTSFTGSARFSGAGLIHQSAGSTGIADGARIDSALRLAGGTLSVTGAVQQNGAFTWSGGEINGGGTLTVSGVLDQTGNTTVYLRNATTLLHTNTSGSSRIANTSSSGLNIDSGSVFSNTGTLTLDVAGSGSIMYIDQDSGSAGLFDNTGTLIKTGSGRVDIGTYGLVSLRQAGTLSIDEGWITLGGSGGTPPAHQISGAQSIASGALLQVSGGQTTLASTATFAGAGRLEVAGGTLAVGNGVQLGSDLALALSSGTLSVAGQLQQNSRFTWTGGQINGGGTLTVAGVFEQSGNTTVYLRDGTTLLHTNTSGSSRIANTSSSGVNIENGSTFRNTGTLTLDVASAAGVMYIDQDSGSAGLFDNAGTLIKTGAGRLDIGTYGLVSLRQTGTLNVSAGSVTFGGSGGTPPEHLLTGTQTIANGARIEVSGGTTRLASGATVSGAGPLRLTGGVLAMDDGTSTGITLQQSGGTLSGTGSNTLSGRYEWTGGTVGGSGTLTVSGALQISGSGSFGLDGRSLRHTNAAGSSALYKTGGYLYVSNGATFTNAAGAALYIDTAGGNSGVWYGGTAGSFVNDGLLVKQGNGTFNFWNPVRLSNTGTLTVAQGTLFADNFTSNSGTLHTLSGAVLNTGNTALTNTGTVSGHGTLVIGGTGLLNRGIVAPGGSNEDGTLRITGHYTQAADGTLQIERGTPGTDALVVSGTATLGGTLTVSSLSGYTPTAVQSDIVSAGTLTGSFATVTLPTGYSTLAVGNRQVLSYAGAICGGICWDGGAGTNLWTDAANWTGDLLPGLNSLVFIDLQNGVSVLLNSGTHTVASLTTTAGNTLTLAGGSLTLSGGASGQNASTLGGNLNISGGTLTANAATSIARLALSAGTLGGSGAITFTGAGSSWTGGDLTGSGSTILAAGSTLDYAAGSRSSARRVDIRQGATLRHLSGVLTLTGGASNAGVIDVAQGVTARYGGSAAYLLDSSGQFAGGGRIEFINSAQATAASTAPTIAESTFTVRVQDSARFTATAPTAIARLELADSAQVIAQSGLQAGTLTQTGGTLTVNAASAVGQYSWAGGTLAGTGALTLLGNGSWTRGTLSGNLVIGNGATLTLSTTGSDDVQGTSYKRFGTGSLSNFGTLAWQEGHIDVVGNARVDNHGLLDITGNFSFGDRSVGVGTITLNNLAGALIRKNGGGETSIGSLGIPGGTANYAVVTNDGAIMVGSGSLRFGVGYSGAQGGGSFIHNGQIDVVAGALLEFGGSLTHNGHTFIDSGATLRRIGGFTNSAAGTIQGFGTLDVGSGNTFRNDGTLQVGDVFTGVNAHGTMQVTGNYLQGSGGRLLMAVGGSAAGQYDRLAVSGSATLGGSLVVSEAAGYARDSVAIDLITANGGLSGGFGTVTLPAEGYAVAQGVNALRLNYAAIVCGGICWDGGAGTDLWTDAANWTGNVLPGLNDLVFISLSNGGQVRLTGGDQRIAALNTGSGSTLTISGGALTITGLSGGSSVASAVAGDVVLTGGTLTVGGQASFAGLRQSGGFSQFDGIATVSRLALSGGEGVTLRTNGRLTVSDSFDWRDQADLDGAGTFTTAGLTTVTGSGGLGFGISVDWHNTGNVNLVNGALLHFYSTSDGNGGALINEAGGVIDLSGGNVLALGTHSGPLSRFVNAGTLIKRSGGDQRLEGNYSFDNLGTVQVDGGRLDIRVSNGDGGADTGRYVSNATLAFGAGQRILAAGSDITGNGAVEFSGARVMVNGGYGIAGTGNTRISAGRADFASALTFANTLTVRGGVLNFNGNTVLNRLEMGWSGGDLATYSVLGGTGTLTFTGSGSTITDGTLASGVVSGYDSGVGPLYVQAPDSRRSITVASGASLTLGGSEYADLSGIALNNQGTLSLVGNIHIHLDNTLDNGGTLQIGTSGTPLNQIADVAWNAPGSLAIRNTGTLEKVRDGSAYLVASLVNEGSGKVDVRAGTLQLAGGYTQGSQATLAVGLGYGTAGRLQADGGATLDGTLEVGEAAGYNRASIDANIVQSASGVTGRFSTQRLPSDYTLATSSTGINLRYNLISCGGICWDGGAGTANWLDAANWTGDRLPGLTDLVFINAIPGANVTLDASPAQTVAGLTIGNGNSFTLNSGVLNAPTTVQAGGTMTLLGGTLNSGGLFSNAGTANLAGGALNASQLANSGTMNLSGSALSAGLITNNGTMNLLRGTPGNLTSTRFDNNGLIVADTGSTLEFGSGGGMIFANNGDVQVRSGTLSVLAHDTDASGPGADTGDYSVAAGATLRFRDAFRDFGPGSSVTGAGNVEFTAFSGGAFNVNGVYSVGGTTRVSGNTLVNFNSSASFGTLDVAGNIGGGGTLSVGDLIWTSGAISGTGRSVIVSGDALIDGRSLSLNGARLNITGSGLIDAGTQLALNTGAQVIVGSGATLGMGSNSVLSGNGSVVNRGTLEGTVGGGSSNIGVLLSNSGTVNAASGSLGLTGGIRTSAGSSFVIGSGATMELGGDLPDDIFDQISGSGALSFSSAVQPVINRSFAAQGGTPFVFSLRSGATLRSGPLQGELTGQAAGWTYTAPDGFNGRQSAVFELSSGGGTALINVVFNVVSLPAVTPPVVQQVTVPLLRDVFQPPRIDVPPAPSAPQVSSPVSIASLDALDNIATASGPQMEQPLRDFRGSRLQCR